MWVKLSKIGDELSLFSYASDVKIQDLIILFKLMKIL